MKIKYLSILLAIFFASLAVSTGEPDAYKLIESSTPGIIGAILGGITAGISIIFGMLSTMKEKLPAIKDNSAAFNAFIDNLKIDVVVLVWCLILSLLLPYFRLVGLPMLVYPTHELMPDRDKFFTAVELTTIIVSASAILEVLSVMFNIFKLSLTSDDRD